MTTPTNDQKAALQSDALEAIHLGQLVEWVIRASTVLDQIESCASVGSELERSLRAHHIHYSNPDWEDCEVDDGLAFVLWRQRKLIRKMAGLEP